jgi:hypothetical protein
MEYPRLPTVNVANGRRYGSRRNDNLRVNDTINSCIHSSLSRCAVRVFWSFCNHYCFISFLLSFVATSAILFFRATPNLVANSPPCSPLGLTHPTLRRIRPSTSKSHTPRLSTSLWKHTSWSIQFLHAGRTILAVL